MSADGAGLPLFPCVEVAVGGVSSWRFVKRSGLAVSFQFVCWDAGVLHI